MKGIHNEFSCRVNGKHVKKIIQTAAFMNSTWDKFNNYANGRGFTEHVQDGKYLGALAWRNAKGDIMELVRVESNDKMEAAL